MHAVAPAALSQLTVLKDFRSDGFRASVVQTTCGRFLAKPITDTVLMFHLGAPARVRCEYNGLGQERVQTRGRFDVLPVGCQASWDDFDPTLSLNVWLSPELLEAADGRLRAAGRFVGFDPQISVEDGRMFAAAQLLIAELESDAPDALFADSLASVLATRLLHRYGARELARARGTLSRPQLRRVAAYVEAHLDGDLRLASLAGLAGLSASHFQLLFRQTVGCTVHQYVVGLRLERARDLLRAGGAIADVAAESGFCHPSHMARAMQRRWRLRPSDLVRDGRAARGCEHKA